MREQKSRVLASAGWAAARLALVAMVFCGLAALGGCSRKAPSDREVWAEVDGAPIFRDEVEKAYRSRMTQGGDAGSEEQSLILKLNILNDLINNQILLGHAAHSQITVSEAEVDKKVADLESPYSKEEFQGKLAEQGIDAADLRQQVRENLIVEKLLNKEIASRLTVTDAEIAAYYERNRDTFDVPETHYHLAQIAVTPVAEPQLRNLKNDDARTAATARRKIQMLYSMLRKGGDFATLAEEYSEDPKTASGGGDMGLIPASAIATDPQLLRAIESLKIGEYSPIFETRDGFHIVKLLGREDPGQHPVTDPQVSSAIRRTLMSEKEELLKSAYIEELRDHAKVVNDLAQKIVAGTGTAATK